MRLSRIWILSASVALGSQTLPEGLEQVYLPTVSPGVESVTSARETLAALLRDRRREVGVRFTKGGLTSIDITKFDNRYELAALLKGGNYGDLSSYTYDDDHNLRYLQYKTVSILEDRIELSPRVAFYYADVLGVPIRVARKRAPDGFPYVIVLGHGLSLHFQKPDLKDAEKAADALQSIQQGVRKGEEEAARFEVLATRYRALAVKPPVTEEQRRFIVQANALNQQKDYRRAIELYRRALAVDPVSYPAAYFNMALLSAQVGGYRQAIGFMKQYLLLEPEAKDARSAQDKIYEWEILLE